MTPGFQSYIQEVAVAGMPSFKDISKFSPSDIREGIQLLVTEDNIPMAQALADAGIAIHPNSEDILAIAGLLAITQKDWPLAIELLQDLCALQGDMVQPMTYQMLGRSLWCNLDLSEARQVLIQGMAAWPEDATLKAEYQEMSLSENVMPASQTSN